MFLHQKFETRSATTLQSISYSELEDRFTAVTKTRILSYQQKEAIIRMQKLLSRKIKNKKCYCFQVLKQFVLYPESEFSSSCVSLCKYDALIFSDEALHSLLKIMETQLMQRKIWGFINLKMNKKEQQVKQLLHRSEKVIKKMAVLQKQQSFKIIKQISSKPQKATHLSKQLVYNYTFNLSQKNEEVGQKQCKVEHNVSKRTIESEPEIPHAIKYSYQMRPAIDYNCRGCNCYSYCCCCHSSASSVGYSLQERIQYLKRLEEMVQQKERRSLQR